MDVTSCKMNFFINMTVLLNMVHRFPALVQTHYTYLFENVLNIASLNATSSAPLVPGATMTHTFTGL